MPAPHQHSNHPADRYPVGSNNLPMGTGIQDKDIGLFLYPARTHHRSKTGLRRFLHVLASGNSISGRMPPNGGDGRRRTHPPLGCRRAVYDRGRTATGGLGPSRTRQRLVALPLCRCTAVTAATGISPVSPACRSGERCSRHHRAGGLPAGGVSAWRTEQHLFVSGGV